MPSQYIDIILFAFLAIFLVFRLRAVLGKKTGLERPPSMRPVTPSATAAVSPRDGSNVIDITPNRQMSPLDSGLREIAAADSAFRPDAFIDGAHHAFEMIVKSFAAGDTATLRPLVSDDVYDAFAEGVRSRLTAKETVETRILKMEMPELLDAELRSRTAQITVKFISSQISVTRDAEGHAVEGDPDKPADHTDIWTFARNVRSHDPNWILISTGHEV